MHTLAKSHTDTGTGMSLPGSNLHHSVDGTGAIQCSSSSSFQYVYRFKFIGIQVFQLISPVNSTPLGSAGNLIFVDHTIDYENRLVIFT